MHITSQYHHQHPKKLSCTYTGLWGEPNLHIWEMVGYITLQHPQKPWTYVHPKKPSSKRFSSLRLRLFFPLRISQGRIPLHHPVISGVEGGTIQCFVQINAQSVGATCGVAPTSCFLELFHPFFSRVKFERTPRQSHLAIDTSEIFLHL